MSQPLKANKNLSHQVRGLALTRIKAILENPKEDYELYKNVLVRLSGSVLPRINEHSGEDGEPLTITLVNYDDKSVSAKKVPRVVTTGV